MSNDPYFSYIDDDNKYNITWNYIEIREEMDQPVQQLLTDTVQGAWQPQNTAFPYYNLRTPIERAPLSDNPRRTEQLCVFGPREPSPVHGRGDKHNTMLSIPVYLSVSTVINYTWCDLVKTFLSVSTCILLQLACYCENKIVNVTNSIALCFIMMYHIIAVYGVTKNRKKFRRACYIAEVSCFRTEWVSPLTAIVKISLLFSWKTSGLYTYDWYCV
jgi:hypothetical protein